MLKITYFAATENMGDNVTEADAASYRVWAKEQIEAQYPEAEVTVSKEQNLNSFWCNDDEKETEVGDFCKSLWDSCPWSWV